METLFGPRAMRFRSKFGALSELARAMTAGWPSIVVGPGHCHNAHRLIALQSHSSYHMQVIWYAYVQHTLRSVFITSCDAKCKTGLRHLDVTHLCCDSGLSTPPSLCP